MKPTAITTILLVATTCWAQQPAPKAEAKSPPKAPPVTALPPPGQQPPTPPLQSCSESGYMRWGFYSEGSMQNAVELVVTDPQGRKTGNDPQANKNYSEIPWTSYGYEGLDDDETGEPGPETGVVEFCNPVPGEYKVQVFGKTTGKYSIEVYATSKESVGKNGLPDAVQSSAMLDNVSIKKGAVQTLTVKYSREPGEKVGIVK